MKLQYKNLRTRKGAVDLSLDNLVMMVLIVAILAGAAGLILEKFQDEMTPNSTAYNATEDGLGAIGDVTTWLGIVVVILIAAFIIEVVRSLGGSSR